MKSNSAKDGKVIIESGISNQVMIRKSYSTIAKKINFSCKKIVRTEFELVKNILVLQLFCLTFF